MIASSHKNVHKTGIEKETSSNLARGSQQGKPARDKPVRSNKTGKVRIYYDVPYENLGIVSTSDLTMGQVEAYHYGDVGL